MNYTTEEELKSNDMMNQMDDAPFVVQPKEPKKKSVVEMFAIIIGLIMIVGLAGWCLMSGVNAMFLATEHPMEEAFSGLVKGDVYEGMISCVTPEVGELKHTINFIPAGTEHFYMMVSEDASKVILVRASSKWHDLIADGALVEVALQERGIVREMDYKVKHELVSNIISSLSAQGIEVEQNLYLDLNANKMGILQLFAGISIIVCALYFAIIARKGNGNGNELKTSAPVGILMLVTGGVIIYLLNMVGF